MYAKWAKNWPKMLSNLAARKKCSLEAPEVFVKGKFYYTSYGVTKMARAIW